METAPGDRGAYGGRGSAPRPPLQLRFQRPKDPPPPPTSTKKPSGKAKSTTPAPDDSENQLAPQEALIIAQLDPTYNDYQLGVDVEPFCRSREATHFWLSAKQPEYALKVRQKFESSLLPAGWIALIMLHSE